MKSAAAQPDVAADLVLAGARNQAAERQGRYAGTGRIMLRIEFDKPKRSVCSCCAGTTTRLTRFVYKDESAFAVYYASFSDNHPERVVDVVVSLGEWGEGTTPDQRRAFSMKIRSQETQYEVMVTSADECRWKDAKIIGRVLDREEALADPLVKDAFHITDHIVLEDEPVKEYLDGRAA